MKTVFLLLVCGLLLIPPVHAADAAPLEIPLPGLSGTFRAGMTPAQLIAAAEPVTLLSDSAAEITWFTAYVPTDTLLYGLSIHLEDGVIQSITVASDETALTGWFAGLVAQLLPAEMMHDSLRSAPEQVDLWATPAVSLSATRNADGYTYEIFFLHPEPETAIPR